MAVEETIYAVHMNATRGRSRHVSSRLPLLLSHHNGDCPRRSEIVDGTSNINCQQHDRLRKLDFARLSLALFQQI